MKQLQAVQHLQTFMRALQKYRSNLRDPVVGIVVPDGTPGLRPTESFMAEMWPWVFGDKCPLTTIVRVLDDTTRTGTLAPMDYYNLMIILDRFMPEVRAVASLFEDGLAPEYKIPQGAPNINVLRGWEAE